ncbi:MAG: leucine-rich repeat domain-containing protein [Promethearchaeota archaeon]|nr:MAG: leucine-rich repeat domain-containing protein [Candidatus Lokiarchaeota archaeon]
MSLTPSAIYQEFQNHYLDKQSAIQFLLTLIENSENNSIRLQSINYLELIGFENDRSLNDKLYHFFENLLISDVSREIRKKAAHILKKKFQDKALYPIKWAIRYETDYECLITIIKTLEKIESEQSKEILTEEIMKLKKRKFIDDNQNYTNKRFKESLDKLFSRRKISDLTNQEMAQIIINYKTIRALIHKFYTIFFQWEDGVISELDLSEIGWNIWNVWRQKYSDRIIDICEIIGLKNLSHLKILDLSNNRIKHIKDLKELKELTNLSISNNRIDDPKNIEYLKQMYSLRYLDISGNKVVKSIDRHEFGGIDIILYKGLPPLV